MRERRFANMKIPEAQANVFYPNEENGGWQGNGMMVEGAVASMGPVVAGGDAQFPVPPLYGVPRAHVPPGGYMAVPGAYYAGPAYAAPVIPPVGAGDDFSEYMWMENEEEFDKQVMQQLEEEALMEQCIEAMLEDERERGQMTNGHSPGLATNGVSLEEQVSKSTLNPLAAEFVPTGVAATVQSPAVVNVPPGAAAPSAVAPIAVVPVAVAAVAPEEASPPTTRSSDVSPSPERTRPDATSPAEITVTAPTEPAIEPVKAVSPKAETPELTLRQEEQQVLKSEKAAEAETNERVEVPRQQSESQSSNKKPTMADIVASKKAKAEGKREARGEPKAAKSESKIGAKYSEPKSAKQKPVETTSSAATLGSTAATAKAAAGARGARGDARRTTPARATGAAASAKSQPAVASPAATSEPQVAESVKSPAPPAPVLTPQEAAPAPAFKPINYAAAARAPKAPSRASPAPAVSATAVNNTSGGGKKMAAAAGGKK